VKMFSSVTLPKLLAKQVLFSDRSIAISFLNYKPLWSFTFASTLVAITGRERMLAKSFVKLTGFTRSI